MILAAFMIAVLVLGVGAGLALRRAQRTTSKWIWDPLMPYSGEGTIALTIIFLLIVLVIELR